MVPAKRKLGKYQVLGYPAKVEPEGREVFL